PRLHVLEERVALFLVLDEWIALSVSAKSDPFLQMIERVEVVLPLAGGDRPHDVALGPPEEFHANGLLLAHVAGLGDLPDGIRELVAALGTQVERLDLLRIDAEHAG